MHWRQPDMKYICDGHRQWLMDNPSELQAGWLRATSMGCEAMAGRQWQRATVCFGNAVEIAELELSKNPDKKAQQHYLDAAAQMMAAFRRLGDQRSCRFLFSRVLDQLGQLSVRTFCNDSLVLLRELTFGDLSTAEKSLWQKLSLSPVRRDALH